MNNTLGGQQLVDLNLGRHTAICSLGLNVSLDPKQRAPHPTGVARQVDLTPRRTPSELPSPSAPPGAECRRVHGYRGCWVVELRGLEPRDPHTASVKTPVLQRVTESTVYRIMPACNPSSY